MAEVVVRVGENEIVSVVTRTSVEELGLESRATRSPRSSSRRRSCSRDEPTAPHRAVVCPSGPPSGLLCEAPRHGWAVARELAPDGEIGRVYSCTRPLVYRALAPAARGGPRRGRGDTPRATRGRRARRSDRPAAAGPRSAAGAPAPVEHVRDLRSELMLKLLFAERAGTRSGAAPPRAGVAARTGRAGARAPARVGLRVRADARPLAPLGRRVPRSRSSRPCSTGGPSSRSSTGRSAWSPQPHADLDGMPLQPIADTSGESRIEVFEAHRGCLDDLEGFSHVWVLAHLHETTGWDPAVPTFLDDATHGTFATRSPRRPNPVGPLARTDRVGRGARGRRRRDRPAGGDAGARPQAVRAAVRRPPGGRPLGLVRRPRGARLPPSVGRPLRAAAQPRRPPTARRRPRTRPRPRNTRTRARTARPSG